VIFLATECVIRLQSYVI